MNEPATTMIKEFHYLLTVGTPSTMETSDLPRESRYDGRNEYSSFKRCGKKWNDVGRRKADADFWARVMLRTTFRDSGLNDCRTFVFAVELIDSPKYCESMDKSSCFTRYKDSRYCIRICVSANFCDNSCSSERSTTTQNTQQNYSIEIEHQRLTRTYLIQENQ